MEGVTARREAVAMSTRTCLDCPTRIFGHRRQRCFPCQEKRSREQNKLRWRNAHRETTARHDDISAAEIDAKLAAYDARLKRTRQQCGRRTP